MLNKKELEDRLKLAAYAELAMLAMFCLITAFEYAKWTFMPNLEFWHSHVATIIFSSVIAGVAGYYVLLSVHLLKRDGANESAKHRMIETELVSDIFREMYDPLTSIKGFAATLREESALGENDRMEFLRIIEEESERLTRLLDQLMCIERIKMGQQQLERAEFRLPDLVHKNIENMHAMAAKNEVIIENRIPSDIPLVYADKERTSEIMTSLLNNAVKRNKRGGRVTVQAKEEGNNVRIEVENTGMGPMPEDMTQIFEKFYRVDQVEERTTETGLELSLAKNLAEAQGGRMSIEKNEDKGSRFVLTLPKGESYYSEQ